MQKLKLIKIDWDNYQWLQDCANKISQQNHFHFLTLVLYKYYKIDSYYFLENETIYIFLKAKTIDGVFVDNYILFEIITNDNNHIQKLLKEFLIKNDIKYLLLDELIINNSEFKPYQEFYSKNYHFLYYKKDLINFQGKKLQKKRNLYNNFIKNNENFKIVAINNENINLMKNYLLDNVKLEYELNSYINLIQNYQSNKMSGSILFLNNEIIGCTLGYKDHNCYEIFIEKARKDIKGAYQYLLATNLAINNINEEIIDRQDDENLSNLYKSKMSYKPFKVIRKKLIGLK